MKPSIGRILWFWDESHQAQPYAAIVTFVHDDGRVNLVAFDDTGRASAKVFIPIAQRGATRLLEDYAEWPEQEPAGPEDEKNKIRRPGIPAIDPSLPDGLQQLLGPIKENIEISMGLRSKGFAVGQGAGFDGWDRRSVTLGMLVKLGVITEAQAKSVWQDP